MFRTFGPSNHLDRWGFAPWLEAGVETGKNLRNKLQEDGSGAVVRFYAGVNLYQRVGVPWAAVTAIYQFRRPFTEEVWFRQLNPGVTEVQLNDDPRHYLELAVVISLQKYLAIKPTYKRGTIPPAFSYLDNEFSLALQVGAKARSTIK
jgi:hypothetical protein